MSYMREILSRNMKRMRKSHGLTQLDLAEKCAVSVEQIKKIEMGKSWTSDVVLESIAKAFRCNGVELFEDSTRKVIMPQDALETIASKLGIEIKVLKPRKDKIDSNGH